MEKKLEMKNDGKDGERFASLLKTVVSVPKEDIKKHEAKQKKKAKKKS
jgi:hypothetical protein